MSTSAGVGLQPEPSADAIDRESERRLRLGTLFVGRPESGVRRYARILTDELERRPDIAATEVDAGLLEGRAGGLAARGRRLADSDVVHMQWNRRGWGTDARSIQRFVDFRRACRRPLVVTLHDVFDRRGLRRRWLEPEVIALRVVGRSATRVVVHSRAEVARLDGIVPLERVRVVPHFVEQRTLGLSPDEARARLGVQGRRIVTLLGFVYGRKGHAILVEAVPRLPADVLVVYAGGPVHGRNDMLNLVQRRSQELGLGDRVRVTGWLDDEAFETWIAATHLAVLPFKALSASGSLSTWIAAGKPILASDLPGFREYDERVPGALRLFSPIQPPPLARAINDQLESGLPDQDPLVVALRDDLTVERTAERYLAVFREALAEAGAGSRR